MLYTESHEWISIRGTRGVVGITEYAQRELGDIVFVELPRIGQDVKAGQEACVLESTKAAADVYAPVSGTVVEVNEAVRHSPRTINEAAETEGWLYCIELSRLEECKNLLSKEQYAALYMR